MSMYNENIYGICERDLEWEKEKNKLFLQENLKQRLKGSFLSG